MHKTLSFKNIGWATVLVSSLGWCFFSGSGLSSPPPIGFEGSGLSIEYHFQILLAQYLPGLSVLLHCLIFPVAAFYFARRTIRYFLSDAWSTLLALLFFSNIGGYPFHEFLLNVISSEFNYDKQLDVKMTDLSTVVGLATLSLLLNPRTLYNREKLFPFLLLSATIYLDALDASAITLIYIAMLGLKLYSRNIKLTTLAAYVFGVFVAWTSSIFFADAEVIHTSGLPNLGVYIGLYFVLPPVLFFASFATLGADPYQVLRRFSGILVVFLSEIIIFGLHYSEIYKVQLSEIQFDSVFPLFHVLYFLPPLAWILNSNLSRRFLAQGSPEFLVIVKRNFGSGFIVVVMLFLAAYNSMWLI